MTRRTSSLPVLGDISSPGRARSLQALHGLAGALVFALALTGCQNRQSQVTPNRVLDRPLDVGLACVRRMGDEFVPQSLDQCSDAVAESVCGDLRLLGFVANSERNDVAMFSRCAGAVIDMNIGAPGPQLISAGEVPSSMTVTTGIQAGCFAVSANLGSCDLSVLDVTGLSAYAFEEPPEEDPAAYVATVVPRRADGTPLGARPGQVLAVPPDLSNAAGLGQTCDPGNPGSVYVTFPSCQLIAEVDLRTQRVLQSRQFVRDGQGGITVVDTGADPVCPIDCAEQFTGPDHQDALAEAPPGDPDGMYPLAMTLVSPPSDKAGCVDDADLAVQEHTMYVGGLGADTIFELRYDGTTWTDDPLDLELLAAQGVSAIRPTPAMQFGDADTIHQFLYVVAGDGSTRVVSRDLNPNRDELGMECDTQVDPTAVTDLACHPAEFPGENPPDRRPFARGPGIRAPNGAIITDWTFQKWHQRLAVEDAGGSFERCPTGSADNPDAGEGNQLISSPFSGPGERGTVYGVGSTSFGHLVFGVFNQFEGRSGVSDTYDRLGLLDARVPPHSLWPSIDPTLAQTAPEGLPRMEDKEPQRLVTSVDDATATRVLGPTLRRIDRAYQLTDERVECKSADDCEDNLPCEKAAETDATGYCGVSGRALAPAIDPIAQDQLARPDDEPDVSAGLYEQDVVRAVVRDYAAWDSAQWSLQWEGEIPGTESFNGQILCQTPGWADATCLSTEPGDTVLVDQTAQFCDRGVLAGDKLFILGCAQHGDCGAGQRCLMDPLAPPGSTGLCVSQVAFDEGGTDQLLEVCRPFLRDECGAARREFAITRAFEQKLHLQVLDRPVESYLMMKPANLTQADAVEGPELEALCRGERVFRAPLSEGDESPCDRVEDNAMCGTTGERPCCSPETYEFFGDPGFVECEQRLSCGPAQPDDGCLSHDDCARLDGEFPLCIDGMCQRVCGPDEDCGLTPLPGPACFRELVHYQVRARNSFVVRGEGAYTFLAQKVKSDDDGECYEDPEVSNLLTSRIRLGRDEIDTEQNALWPIPSCPADSDRPSGGTPNPCFIENVRPPELLSNTPLVTSLYHQFCYGLGLNCGDVPGPRTVRAIRYSNPMMSLVIDLTSLLDLAKPIPNTEEARWPPEFAAFKRSRIQGAYREAFGTRRGYIPYDADVVTSSVSLVGPTRIINAPELSTVFVVDSSGGTTRGQVVRVTLTGGQVTPDVRFLVR